MANIFSLFGTIFIDNQEANKSIDDTTKKGEGAGSKIGKAFSVIGSTAVSMGKATVEGAKMLGGAVYEMATDAAKQETAFAKVKTLLSGTEEDIQGIYDQIIKASGDTGVAFEDFSDATYSAISASVDQADAVDFTTNSIKLAKGGFTDAATAVDVLTTALNAYGLGADKATEISDMLITTQNLGKTTVDELAGSLGAVIPIASGANVAMDDLSTQYAVLTKNGIATAEAGTMIKSMLGELSKTGSTTDKALKEIYGKGFAQLQKEGKSTAEILNVLSNYAANSGLTLKDLFSKSVAGSAAMTLVKDGGKDFANILKEMGDSAGATEQAFETMGDTLEAKIGKMQNKFALVKQQIGTALIPVVEQALSFISDNMDNIEKLIEQLIPVATGVFDTVLPPLLEIGETILPSLLTVINQLLPPLQNVIKAILPVVVQFINKAIPPLIKIAQSLLPIVIDLVNELSPILADMIDTYFTVYTELLNALLPVFEQLVKTILPPLLSIVKAILPPLTNIVNAILPVIVDLISTLLPVVIQIEETVLPVIAQLIEALMPSLTDISRSLLTTIVELIKESLPSLIQLVEAVLPIIVDLLNELLPIIQPLLEALLTLLTPLLDLISFMLPELIDLITEIVKVAGEYLHEIMEFFIEVANTIKEYAQGLADWFDWFIEYLVTDFTTDWVEGWQWIGKFFEDIWNSIIEFFTGGIEEWVSLFENSKKAVSDWTGSIKKTISNALNTIKKTFTTIIDSIKEKVNNIISSIKSIITTGLDAAKEVVTGRLDKIKQTFGTVFDKVKNTVKTAIDKIKSFFNFEVHLPDIKLPHFSIDPSGWELGDLLEGEIPSLGIEWYAKGAVLKKPTIFDIDPSTNTARVGGEAGDEAVAPVDTLLTYIRQAVRETITPTDSENPSVNISVSVHVDNINNNTGKDADEFIDYIMYEIENKIKRKGVVFG